MGCVPLRPIKKGRPTKMNLDENLPPTPAELEQQADDIAKLYRTLATVAKAPITLSFGKKSGRLRRNSPCPCNSGLKYKVCCMKKVDRGEYKRLGIDGPIDPKSQPRTVLGPSRGVMKYIKRKIAERNAAATAAYLAGLETPTNDVVGGEDPDREPQIDEVQQPETN